MAISAHPACELLTCLFAWRNPKFRRHGKDDDGFAGIRGRYLGHFSSHDPAERPGGEVPGGPGFGVDVEESLISPLARQHEDW